MPIKIPNDLPAFEKLQQEGVHLIAENEALRQDIRPMQVALLNLMPEKPKTETQLARLLAASPLQVELTLLTTSTYARTRCRSRTCRRSTGPGTRSASASSTG